MVTIQTIPQKRLIKREEKHKNSDNKDTCTGSEAVADVQRGLPACRHVPGMLRVW